MEKLKLSSIEDDKPVKLAIEIPAKVHRDLVAYAALITKGSSGSKIEPGKLVAPMVAKFMASDRAFTNMRRRQSLQENSKRSNGET